MNKAIFLDRDGVINKLLGEGETPECYVTSWEQFEFLPGAKEAIAQLLRDTDYSVMIISNQSGIGRGFVDYATVFRIFATMQERVLIELDVEYKEIPFWTPRFDFYFCPHAPDAGCACRKPSPGMLYKAAIEHEIDLSKSWMVGDSETDMIAGRQACVYGCITIGRECKSLLEAVEYILEQEAENVSRSASKADCNS